MNEPFVLHICKLICLAYLDVDGTDFACGG